ncbi:Uncharacterised protein [Legionella taurinensis]|nr:Uncharacterised protein [Legionella taurinensis]
MSLFNPFIIKLIKTHDGIEAFATSNKSLNNTLDSPCIARTSECNYSGKIL